jgi:hypothetical protein
MCLSSLLYNTFGDSLGVLFHSLNLADLAQGHKRNENLDTSAGLCFTFPLSFAFFLFEQVQTKVENVKI